MALVHKGTNPLKIDIEVDGDCHRNPDGTRKIDDIWRDIQLHGLGWKVMRFWTYQLREDMEACVDKILKEWKKHE
jgi:very-short-patch-repair endonuclease